MTHDDARLRAADDAHRALQHRLDRIIVELERLLALTEHSPIGIIAIDADGQVVFENDFARQIAGGSLIEAGDEIRAALNDADLDPIREAANAARDDGVDAAREPDTVGRLGGDEFVVVAEDIDGPRDGVRLAMRIVHAFDEVFDIEGTEAFVTASVGVSFRSGPADTAATMLRDADVAMYRAKEAGGARYEEAHALARWYRPGVPPVLPSVFIPLAEETGLIPMIGAHVLIEACGTAAEWNDGREGSPPLDVAVNVSARQLARYGLMDVVERSLVSSGLDPKRLTLEITESVLVQDPEIATERLQSLRARPLPADDAMRWLADYERTSR